MLNAKFDRNWPVLLLEEKIWNVYEDDNNNRQILFRNLGIGIRRIERVRVLESFSSEGNLMHDVFKIIILETLWKSHHMQNCEPCNLSQSHV